MNSQCHVDLLICINVSDRSALWHTFRIHFPLPEIELSQPKKGFDPH